MIDPKVRKMNTLVLRKVLGAEELPVRCIMRLYMLCAASWLYVST